MIQDIAHPERFFADRFGLDPSRIERLLGSTLLGRVEDADLYLEYRVNEELVLEEGAVKKASRHVSQGAGVRAQSGERTGYAHTDEITLPNLEEAAAQARAIADRSGSSGIVAVKPGRRPHDLYHLAVSPVAADIRQKVDLLEKVDARARAADPRVRQVIASLAGQYEVIMVARHDGMLAADVRPLVRLSLQVIVEDNGRREQGSAGGGGRFDYSYFSDERLQEYAAKAVDQALVNLEASPAPAGAMTVVLGPGWPGILLHEAIGHGLEGDFNRKGSSAFSGRIGERVAAPGVTVVDDGTIPQRRGSLAIDDEGNPTQRTVLIEDGVLRGYMQDSLNARLMKAAPTGNGRRESYAHIPMPRMTNTYMLNGRKDPEEILRSVKSGLYAVNFGGGQVDIVSGKFVFSAAEAYLIENGRIGMPVRGATLIGNGPDVLTRVSMIGNDMMLDPGVGTCGKDGQSVPVGVGQPTLRIDGLTVGGTV